jgi:hypothetical protein
MVIPLILRFSCFPIFSSVDENAEKVSSHDCLVGWRYIKDHELENGSFSES